MLSKHISKGVRNFLIPNPLCLQTETASRNWSLFFIDNLNICAKRFLFTRKRERSQKTIIVIKLWRNLYKSVKVFKQMLYP
ncbi:hypothetical protein ABIE66_002988 [Peribacillus sp. B2I2]